MNNELTEYYNTRVVVLGASGFIGRWVARRLSAVGAELYLVIRNAAVAGRRFSRYDVHGQIVELDLNNVLEIKALFHDIAPAITFNLAGYGVDRSERDEATAYRINANLLQVLCEAIEPIRHTDWPGQHIVHAGSALEYGAIPGNLAEDSTPNPTTLYGKSKLAGTRTLVRHCRSTGVRGITARLFTVYGPGEHAGRLLPALIDTARTGNTLQLTAGTQQRDFTYVEDVAEGLLRLGVTNAQPGEIVNLATGQLHSVREFAATAATILEIPDGHLQFGALDLRSEEMAHDPVTIRRLRRLTSWAPTNDISTGILKTATFLSRMPAQP